jgi:hypothetical protein
MSIGIERNGLEEHDFTTSIVREWSTSLGGSKFRAASSGEDGGIEKDIGLGWRK